MRVGNIHEPQTGVNVTKIPSDTQTEALRRHGDITLARVRNVDEDGRYEEEAPENSTVDYEGRIIQMNRKPCKCPTTIHTESVDDIADGELHDPDSEPEDDTTEPNSQDPNEQEESSHDASINSSFNDVPEDDELENEQESGVNDTVSVTHKADDLSAANGITSSILWQSQVFWREASTTKTVGPSSHPTGIQRYQPIRKDIGSEENQPRDGRRHQRILTTNQNQQRDHRCHARHDLMESDFESSRLEQPIRPTTSITTTATTKQNTRTNNAQD